MQNHPLANSILLSDLHLTSNERDKYRWELFPWLHEQLKGKKIQRIFLLGDLTEAKDYHAAKLVNRLIEALSELSQKAQLLVLRGNHDGVDPEWPYFNFLSSLPNVEFFAKPGMVEGTEILMLPHTRDWHEWSEIDLSAVEAILMHATVSGAESESGQTMAGVPAELFADLRCPIYAGDIHVPQKVGNVEYVGAPYPIRFGDSFEPRILYFDALGKKHSIRHETIRRVGLTISKVEELKNHPFRQGDQYKIRVQLSKADAVDWHKVKEKVRGLCKKAGVDLLSLELERGVDQKHVSLKQWEGAAASPTEVFHRYCDQKRIPEGLRKQGESLMQSLL